jgi:single-strand DNA-binding protein
MASFNKVILVGNLTRDPELRYTSKGTAVARIGMAVNRSWRDESGQLREEATFVDVEAFARSAETIGQYLKKGSPLLIEGRLRTDSWEDKQTNQKRSRLVVVLESFRFLDSRANREGGAPESPRTAPITAPAVAPNSIPVTEVDNSPPEEDDVPF